MAHGETLDGFAAHQDNWRTSMSGLTLKAGARLRSAVSDVQIMVLRAPAGPLDVRCHGVAMLPVADAPGADTAADEAFAGECLTGKRYVDEAETIEVLCTKGGAGLLSLGAVALAIKQAKQLPSSD
jgi:hypothetical protein